MSKFSMYETIFSVLSNADFAEKEDALAFVRHEQEMLEAKAEKAKKYADKKREAGQELLNAVEHSLTDEAMTIESILNVLEGQGFEDLTAAKVTPRLTTLVKDGKVVKELIKIDGKKRMAYRLSPLEVEAEITE